MHSEVCRTNRVKYVLHYCFPFSFLCITVVSTDWIDYCQYERPATDTAI